MSVSQFVFSELLNARGRTNVAVCESELEREGGAVGKIGGFVKEGQSNRGIFFHVGTAAESK